MSNGIPTSIASFTPQLTFDLTNNKITNISNSVTGSKTAVPNPAVIDNRFDPATMDGLIFCAMADRELSKK